MDEKTRKELAELFAKKIFKFAQDQDFATLPSLKKYFSRKRKEKIRAEHIFVYYWGNYRLPPIPMIAKVIDYEDAKELFQKFEKADDGDYISVALLNKKKVLALEKFYADDAHRLTLLLCGVSLPYLYKREAGFYLCPEDAMVLKKQ